MRSGSKYKISPCNGSKYNSKESKPSDQTGCNFSVIETRTAARRDISDLCLFSWSMRGKMKGTQI